MAAVGPYIQSSQGPEHQEVLVKTANADGEATLPTNDSLLKPPPRPPKPATGVHVQFTPTERYDV